MTRDLILIVADRATGEVMEGEKPSGFQIAPKEPDEVMLWRDEAPFSPRRVCRNCGIEIGASKNEQKKFFKAMLSASRVDLTKAEVKPELWAVFDDEGLPDHLTIDKQMALDHIKHALQLASDSGDTESAR